MRRRSERGKPFINDHGNATSRRRSPILCKHRTLMKSYEKNTNNEKKLDFGVVRDHVWSPCKVRFTNLLTNLNVRLTFLVCHWRYKQRCSKQAKLRPRIS